MKVSIQLLLVALVASCMLIACTQAKSPGWLINRYYQESEDVSDELADALVNVILSDRIAHEVKPNNAGKYNPDEIFYKKRTRSLADRIAHEVKPNNAGKYNPDEIFYKKRTRSLADRLAYEVKPNNAGKYNADEIFYKKTRTLADRLIEHIYQTFDERPRRRSGVIGKRRRMNRELADRIAHEVKPNNAGKYNPDRPVL